jgi:hypothetical protein
MCIILYYIILQLVAQAFAECYMSHHHHASLLNSSIKQVNCVGGMAGIEPTASHAVQVKRLDPAFALPTRPRGWGLTNLSWWVLCKAVRPGRLVRPKIRPTRSGIDLLTILRCLLSCKTVVMSRKIIGFKIKISLPKNSHPSRVLSSVPRVASCYIILYISISDVWNIIKL